ncbi:MAG TPA: hypothetical protein DCE23_02065 [Firmicutes bacterium]|nr:hypothetical protein [Bacillota bacterium]
MKKEEILNNINEGLMEFRDVPISYYDDCDVILLCVKRYGIYVLDYIKKDIFNNKGFVIRLIDSVKGDINKYISNDFRDDKDVMIHLVRVRGLNLEIASERLQDDYDVVLEAVKSNWEALRYASSDLCNNKDIAKCYIVSNNYSNLKYIGKELKNDKKFILPFIMENGKLLKDVSLDLKKDKDVVYEAVLNDVGSLRYADKVIRNDRPFMIELVKISDKVLKYISDDLKRDEVFMVRATNAYQVSLF